MALEKPERLQGRGGGGREDNNNKIFYTRDINLEAKALRTCLHYIELRKTVLFLCVSFPP